MAQSQQSKLLLYLIMMLGIVLGYLYSSSSDPTLSVPGLPPELQLSSLQPLEGARIDEAILSSEAFRSLKVFGSLPVLPTASGKENPFQ
jgi:hypothetical protein